MIKQKKLALISGAAGGIGQAIARKLHAQGYQLLLVDREEQALLTMQQGFANSLIEVCDLANAQSLEALCRKVEALTQPLEIAIINAGIIIPGDTVTLSRRQLDQHLDVNLRSAMHLNHACAGKMQTQGHGHLINTVSMSAFIALKGSAAYTATKFGLRGFLLPLAAELAPHGVSVSAVYPSGIDTPMLRYEALNGGSPLNFINQPHSADDVAAIMLRALKTKKLEYYVPYGDSVFGRLVCSFPWVLMPLYPLLQWWGERGRKKFISSRNLTMTASSVATENECR